MPGTIQTDTGSLRSLGSAQYTSAVAATALTAAQALTGGVILDSNGAIASGPNKGVVPAYALFYVETQAIRYWSSGLVPTASVGIVIPTNAIFKFNGSLAAFQMIQVAPTAIINIEYYG